MGEIFYNLSVNCVGKFVFDVIVCCYGIICGIVVLIVVKCCYIFDLV